ncbi:MAG: polysaccharide lyase beta-sandwich domain-containing protein [Culturomica sp.]|jgi:chondroitin AC lyase|nr:polysaccharide lyase beta-sandwich domain-containing protein [Culturomica sp.]
MKKIGLFLAIPVWVAWIAGTGCCYAGGGGEMLRVGERIKASYYRVLNDAPEIREEIRDLLEQSANPDIMIRELKEGSDPRQAERLMRSMRPDGSWSDIDYADQSRSGWAPSYHAERLRTMAVAYGDPDSPLFRSRVLSEALHRGLAWWFAGNFRCPNWWYNQIGVPKMLGAVFLLLEAELGGEELQQAIRYMENSRLGQTGQNSVWLAENVLIRSLLQGDEELFLRARAVLLKELRIHETGEGIRPDYSFQQHGPQQQFGNYGLAFANTEAYWARIFSGTEYALSEEQLSVLRNYLLQGMRFTVYKGYMHVGACGRQLFRGSLRGKALSLGKALRNMMEADTAYRKQYETCYYTDIAAGVRWNGTDQRPATPRFFPFSDYGVCPGDGWLAELKMSSSRVIGSETVNSENLLGNYLGMGALFLYKTGAEYRDIFPVWDWTKLPGVTAFDTEALFPGKIGAATFQNKHAFAGSLSTGGPEGSAAMVVKNDGLTALKSWFFLHDRVICLGSGIRGEQPYRITTAVEQKNGNGSVTVLKEHNGQPVACRYDDVVYASLDNRPLQIRTDTAAGNWNRVAAFYDTTEVRKPRFTLWFDHGVSPASARYAYAIFPGKEEVSLKSHIIRQDEQVHAIQTGPYIQCVFFQPDSLQPAEDLVLRIDRPCMVQMSIAQQEGAYRLALCDPSWQEEEITVTLTGKWEGQGCRYEPAAGCTRLTVDVRQAQGKTFSRVLFRLE